MWGESLQREEYKWEKLTVRVYLRVSSMLVVILTSGTAQDGLFDQVSAQCYLLKALWPLLQEPLSRHHLQLPAMETHHSPQALRGNSAPTQKSTDTMQWSSKSDAQHTARVNVHETIVSLPASHASSYCFIFCISLSAVVTRVGGENRNNTVRPREQF